MAEQEREKEGETPIGVCHPIKVMQPICFNSNGFEKSEKKKKL